MYNLSQVVLTLRADLGVMLYSDGERIALVDEKGHAMQEAQSACRNDKFGRANPPRRAGRGSGDGPVGD